VSATALVGIGSNLGERLGALRDAVVRIDATSGVRVVGRSGVYECRAWGSTGPDYLNAVIVVETSLEPVALLAELLAIEVAMGRVRRERWGPRVIDLDLLAWMHPGAVESVITHGHPELPHPRMTARDFVLVPLVEVWPALRVGGVGIVDVLAALPDAQRTILARVDAVL
jgi:2-amino-4-hydroxy-6-hydroxymethyldihydropteridine diphosphokinase